MGDSQQLVPVVIGITVGLVGVVGLVFLLKRKGNNSSKSSVPFLNRQRQKVPLVEKIRITHDTYLFRFGLPNKDSVLGLPVGKHFKVYCPNPKGSVSGKWNGQDDAEAGETEIERKYTPVSSDDDRGHVDLVLKIYRSGVVDRFPDGGKMSQYFDKLKIGDKIDISGPWGLIQYNGKGSWSISSKPLQKTKIGMMAGGTGITPMLQIINAVLKDPSDPTELSLIFANQTADDILVRDRLEALASKYPTRFKLWYTLDRPPTDWKYDQGFITAEMIQKRLPGPSPDTLILMCGPPPMVKFACQANLEKLGYPKDQQAAF